MRRRSATWLLGALCLLLWSLDFCFSMNDEGVALLRFKKGIEYDPDDALSNWMAENNEDDPCDWRGIKCEDGKVSYLNLKDLRLRGTLAPELGKLSHLRYLILRNNCFRGVIPKEIGDLLNLEILDLSHNDLTAPIPSSLSNLSSLQLLSIEGNPHLGDRQPELHDLCVLSDAKADRSSELTEDRSSSRRVDRDVSGTQDGSQNTPGGSMPNTPPGKLEGPPASSPAQSPERPPRTPPHDFQQRPTSEPTEKKSKKKSFGIWLVVLGVVVAAGLVLVGLICYRSKKVTTIKPWSTGLSGQLQKAFVTGVTKLRRPELEAACEGFSNVIGELSDCTLYKGILSNGVEIAVASTMVNSAKDWYKVNEDQFTHKIATLSKVNHKNFSNLLGYCQEDEPFTRMMVFEYAPNGTLHEHLYVREGEDLDWERRLRVIMGIAYCLSHVDQLAEPIRLENLTSESVYLTDDLAAKISDFEFRSKTAEVAVEVTPPAEIVPKFGLLLLEIITGRRPVLAWAEDYLTGAMPSSEFADQNLKSFKEDQMAAICELVVRCCRSQRPSMGEVKARLRQITMLAPEAAAPKSSPLWWAELEIASGTDA